MLDVDDRLRALQIQLLASRQTGWFDLSIPAVRLPEVYVSPWSRLVDLPYVAIGWMLAPLMGGAQALRLAFSVWPLVMLAVFSMLAAVFVLRPLAAMGWTSLRTGLVLCLVTLIMGPALCDFSPGRIDHHNWQLIAMVCLMVGLQRFDRVGGLLVGLSSASSLLVGLECLPLIVCAYGGLVICWFLKMPGGEAVMGSAGGSAAVASALLGVIFVGPDGLMTAACDSFSAPFALAAFGFGSVLMALGWWGRALSTSRRLVLLIVAAVPVLASVLLLYPECLGGPYAMIGPDVRAAWLDRIPQEHGLLFQVWNGSTNLLPILAVLSLISVWTIPVLWEQRPQEPGQAVAFAVALAALVATLVQVRYARFSVALLPLFVPLAIGWILSGRAKFARPMVSASSALLVVVLVLAAVGIAKQPARIELTDTMANSCEHADFSAVENLAPGRVLAPHGLGLPLLEAGRGRLQVAAIPFHRAAPGLATVFVAFLSEDIAVRQKAVESFDYVAVCALPSGQTLLGGGMYAALINGHGWPGLEEWSSGSLSPLRIFRINHAQFR